MRTRSVSSGHAVLTALLAVILLGFVAPVDHVGHAHQASVEHTHHLSASALTPDPTCVLLASRTVEHTFVRPATFDAGPRLAAATATFIVNYTGFTPQAQVAFQYAVDIWATRVASAVPIAIDARFEQLDGGLLGFAGPTHILRDFPGAPVPGTWYPAAIANATAGFDLGDDVSDLSATFNSSFGWYFGTDGAAPGGTYDFVTVVLHEIGHGLGFFGSASVDTTGGTVGHGRWGYGTSFPAIWDRFVRNGAGQALLESSLFPNPSLALGAQLTSSNLFFTGPQTQAAARGFGSRLYAPPTFQPGSSYSHLNESTYPAGDPNSLMTPFLGSAEAIHDPGPLTMGMFRDMGLPTAAACTYTLSETFRSFSGAGGPGTVTLTTGTSCPWLASSNASWVTITSTTSGAGSITLTYTVAPNPSSTARTAQVTIAGQVLTVQQTGVPCQVTVDATSSYVDAEGGTRLLQVTATAPECSWSMTTSAPWLTPLTPAGLGSQAAAFTAAPNPGAAQRIGVLVVAGVSVTVIQRPRTAKLYLDLDGSGLGDILLYDQTTGAYSMQRSMPGSFSTLTAGSWVPGWIIKKARWNADSLDDLFFYNPDTGFWFKVTNLGNGTFSFFGYRWAAGWVPTIIDLDGDGLTDVFLYDPATGQWFRCMTVAGSPDFVYTPGAWATGWQVFPADFNADGRGDLFLYNTNPPEDPNSGKWFRVMSAPSGAFTYVAHDVRWANDWQITPGDFTGNGRTDLFLYRANGQWFRVSFTETGSAYLGGAWAPNWTLWPGDFDGDRRADFLLYNRDTGQWFVALSRDGGFSYHSGAWAAGWDVAIADLDNDGISDIVLYNPVTGMWFQALTRAAGVFWYYTGSWPPGKTMIN